MNDEDSDQFQSADEGIDSTSQPIQKDPAPEHIPTTPEVSTEKNTRLSKKKSTSGVTKKKLKKRKGTANAKKTAEDGSEKHSVEERESSTPEKTLQCSVTPTACTGDSDRIPLTTSHSSGTKNKKPATVRSSNEPLVEEKDSSAHVERQKLSLTTNAACSGAPDHTSSANIETVSVDASSEKPCDLQTSEKLHRKKKGSSTPSEPLRSAVSANTTCVGDSDHTSSTKSQATSVGTKLETTGTSDLVASPELPPLDFDQIPSAAGSLLKGVGDGLSTLADTIIQPLYDTFQTNSCDPDELAARRRQRKEEEEAERRAVAEAWSGVWDAAWGIDDGWEVEDDPVDDTAQDENVCETKHSMDSVNSMMKDLSTHGNENDRGTTMWDWSGVSTFAQQLTSSLQSTSLQLVQEGVGVLERIGKKTMSVIEENDPGFRHTKRLLRPSAFAERPSLSQIIREAQEKDRNACNVSKKQTKNSDKTGFLSELESQRGLVHLEALELVGERAVAQLHARLDSSAYSNPTVHQDKLDNIWNTLQMDAENSEALNPPLNDSDSPVCKHPPSLPDEHSQLWRHFQQPLIHLKCIYPGDRLLQLTIGVWNGLSSNEANKDTQDLCRQAGRSLATLTCGLLEYLHKLAECALVQNSDQQLDYINLVAILELCIRSYLDLEGHLCDEYVKLIKSASTPSSPNSSPDMRSPTVSTSQLVANLLLDCGNAQNYIRDATRLLAPVFQLAYAESYLSDS